MKFATDTMPELEAEAEDALRFIQSSGAVRSGDTRLVLLAEARHHLAHCLAILDQVEPSPCAEGGDLDV